MRLYQHFVDFQFLQRSIIKFESIWFCVWKSEILFKICLHEISHMHRMFSKAIAKLLCKTRYLKTANVSRYCRGEKHKNIQSLYTVKRDNWIVSSMFITNYVFRCTQKHQISWQRDGINRQSASPTTSTCKTENEAKTPLWPLWLVCAFFDIFSIPISRFVRPNIWTWETNEVHYFEEFQTIRSTKRSKARFTKQ